MKHILIIIILFISSFGFAQDLPILKDIKITIGYNNQKGQLVHDQQSILQWPENPFYQSNINPEQEYSFIYMANPWAQIKLYHFGLYFSETGNQLFDVIGVPSKSEMYYSDNSSFSKIEGSFRCRQISADWYVINQLALSASYLDLRYQSVNWGNIYYYSDPLRHKNDFLMKSKGLGLGAKANYPINDKYKITGQFYYYPELDTKFTTAYEYENMRKFKATTVSANLALNRQLISDLWGSLGVEMFRHSAKDYDIKTTRAMITLGIYYEF